MTKFEESELKGRKLFEEVLLSVGITTWLPTKDLYNRVDGYFTKDNKLAVVEIKGRSKLYADYSTHLMELDKYTAIVKDALDKGIKCAYYACFFGDDILYLYNVGLIKYNCDILYMWCPKTTAVNSDMVQKKCIMIHKEIASIYEKIDGIWKKKHCSIV